MGQFSVKIYGATGSVLNANQQESTQSWRGVLLSLKDRGMNVLNRFPKLPQPKAKAAIHNIWQAETKEGAQKAFDLFIKTYEAKYPKAVLCLQKDREEFMAFFDFPPSIGRASAPAIQSNPRSLQSATAPNDQRAVSHAMACCT